MALDHVLSVLSTPYSCLIGHNIKADINFIKSVSTKKINMPIFDTQIIYRQATFGDNMLGLIRVLDEIGIPHSNLHNAGNDAYYTLETFKILAKI
jgi:DNA polymerase III alpha subunit (gram-positive type)